MNILSIPDVLLIEILDYLCDKTQTKNNIYLNSVSLAHKNNKEIKMFVLSERVKLAKIKFNF